MFSAAQVSHIGSKRESSTATSGPLVTCSRRYRPSVFVSLSPRAPAAWARSICSAGNCGYSGSTTRFHDGSVKVVNRPGYASSNSRRASASPAPTPPVKLTMVRTPLRSITGNSAAGSLSFRIRSPNGSTPSGTSDHVTCVCTSMTGNRGRSTRVSATWSMLRGSKSGSAIAASGVVASAGSPGSDPGAQAAPTAAAAPTVPMNSRRFMEVTPPRIADWRCAIGA